MKTEIVSSDFCRGLVCDDENNQYISEHAFDLLHFIVEKRLLIGRLTIADATNVHEHARRQLINIAKKHNCLSVAIAFNLPEELSRERDRTRIDRHVGGSVIRNHMNLLKKSINTLNDECYKYVYILNSEEEVNNVEIIREGWVPSLIISLR